MKSKFCGWIFFFKLCMVTTTQTWWSCGNTVERVKYKWGAFFAVGTSFSLDFEVGFFKIMYGNHPTNMVKLWEYCRKSKIQMRSIFWGVCLFVKCFGNPHSSESEVIYLHVLPQSTTKGECQCISLNRKVPFTPISPLQYTKEKPIDLGGLTSYYLWSRGKLPEHSCLLYTSPSPRD